MRKIEVNFQLRLYIIHFQQLNNTMRVKLTALSKQNMKVMHKRFN